MFTQVAFCSLVSSETDKTNVCESHPVTHMVPRADPLLGRDPQVENPCITIETLGHFSSPLGPYLPCAFTVYIIYITYI